MRLLYSIGVTFAGGGIGSIAYRAVSHLHREGMLHRLLCGAYRKSEIPEERIAAMGISSQMLRRLALHDRSRRVNLLHNRLYDRWAAAHLREGDWFHGWGNYSLKSMSRARARGMTVSIERASSHPAEQVRLMRDEYRRWGLQFRLPHAVTRRALAEIDLADYVVVPSEFVRGTFLKHGVADEKIIVLPFGTDITRFHPGTGKQSDPTFRVVFVGQVSVRKGVPDLLESWRRLNWHDAELRLVGRIAADFRPLLQRFGSLPGVRFVGHADPAAHLRAADVFVFPTIEEGSALVTYEAMASGLPVITTPNSGSIVRDGVDGFIIPLRDSDVLAERLEQLRADTELRHALGRSARQRVEGYSWEEYGRRLTACFLEHYSSREADIP